jgi:hypothetical protein
VVGASRHDVLSNVSACPDGLGPLYTQDYLNSQDTSRAEMRLSIGDGSGQPINMPTRVEQSLLSNWWWPIDSLKALQDTCP